MRFAEQTIAAFLDAVASAEPTPGGGTAAAVSGALGASLLMMVAGLPKSRGDAATARQHLTNARDALTAVRTQLLDLADEDTASYLKVVNAYRLPKTTDEEKAARVQAVQQALHAATEAPLATLRATAAAVTHARQVAQFGNPSALSDVRVALELLEAAAAGANANVESNLPGITDDAFRRQTASVSLEVSNRLTEDLAAARAALRDASTGLAR